MSSTPDAVQGLDGAVVAVAGAAGPAGRAAMDRLAATGATVIAADADARRLSEAVEVTRAAHEGARIVGETVDLLDLSGHPRVGREDGEGTRPGRRPAAPGRRLARLEVVRRDRPR